MAKDQKEFTHWDVILDSIADGVFTVDRNWNITYFNRAAEDITGIPKEEAIGRPCCDVLRASICESACALRKTIDTGVPIVNQAIYIVNSEGMKIPVAISTALLKDPDGNVIGGVESFRDLSVVEELRKELEGRYSFADIISRNPKMYEIFGILPQVAESNSTVLIQGESGTGKELLARAIHNLSNRSEGPMVAVNCAALPDTLLESELFGYVKGAFTDARKDKPGRFALAEGGTIFLDEIGDISPALQVKLLRVIQEKTYEPLGSTQTRKADVRIIAATNRDLEKMVKEGKFRQDLYFRINVISIKIPPLRKRREDIPLLIDHFIARFNRIYDREITGISPAVSKILLSYDYPGNIRELENILEHGFILCKGNLILTEHLPDHLRPEPGEMKSEETGTLKEIEARLIKTALIQHRGDRKKTAKELGIHPSTLWRKIKKFGIKVPKEDGRSRK
ncbi:MAG: sigma 54-interacting transcriptional regulator [Candidatus Eremiobacteraeota bacterium]|nr:sigma 54-interacting transcriptional regulator [Candidatus Eremiobacteraeota bacterium]